MSQLDKLLDKITKKVDQVEKLHDKESLLCEEVKDLIEEIRENHVEEDHTWEEDDDNLEEDFDEEELYSERIIEENINKNVKTQGTVTKTKPSAIRITAVSNQGSEQSRIEEAKLKGYTGDICQECGQATMLRNGTCLKCDNCGATSGCS